MLSKNRPALFWGLGAERGVYSLLFQITEMGMADASGSKAREKKKGRESGGREKLVQGGRGPHMAPEGLFQPFTTLAKSALCAWIPSRHSIARFYRRKPWPFPPPLFLPCLFFTRLSWVHVSITQVQVLQLSTNPQKLGKKERGFLTETCNPANTRKRRILFLTDV